MSIIKKTCTPATMFSGDRFSVTYRLSGSEEEARAKAEDICIEQTVEFPAEEVPEGIIRDHVFGRIESFGPWGGDSFNAVISYANEIAAGELTQFLNVVFGNSSIKPGIRVEHLDLPESLLHAFKGPRFGRARAPQAPECTEAAASFHCAQAHGAFVTRACRPGVPVRAGRHGYHQGRPRSERSMLLTLRRTGAVLRRSCSKRKQETGQPCLYIANITAPHREVMKRARFAKQAGAGGLMVAPGLIGFDLMRELADDDALALPILTHPALQGSFVTGRNGISHGVIFGQLARLGRG